MATLVPNRYHPGRHFASWKVNLLFSVFVNRQWLHFDDVSNPENNGIKLVKTWTFSMKLWKKLTSVSFPLFLKDFKRSSPPGALFSTGILNEDLSFGLTKSKMEKSQRFDERFFSKWLKMRSWPTCCWEEFKAVEQWLALFFERFFQKAERVRAHTGKQGRRQLTSSSWEQSAKEIQITAGKTVT